MKRMMMAVLAGSLVLPTLLLNTGCTDAQMKAFKTNAAAGLGDGIKSILSAMVDGAMAAATPAINKTSNP